MSIKGSEGQGTQLVVNEDKPKPCVEMCTKGSDRANSAVALERRSINMLAGIVLEGINY